MDWLNQPGEWAALVSIITAVLAGLVWLIRQEVRNVRATTQQLLPNGGKSLADKVDLIVARQQEIAVDIRDVRKSLADHNEKASQAHARLHERIDEHVHDHLRGPK